MKTLLEAVAIIASIVLILATAQQCAFRRNRSPVLTETDHLSEPATRDLL